MYRFILLVCTVFCIASLRAQPVNDSCHTAILLGDITTLQAFTADFTLATESLDASCESINNLNRDLWYIFSMPFTGNVELDGLSGIDRATLYDQCAGTELFCAAGDQFYQALPSGMTYLLRLSTTQPNRVINPEIIAHTLAANDECNAAFAMMDLANEQSIQLDSRNATFSSALSCDFSGSDNVDLWYVFTMPFDGRIITEGVHALARVGLVDGCGAGAVEIACNQGGGYFENLMGGQLYYLRYAIPVQYVATDDFTLQAFALASNDECNTPQALGDISVQTSIIPDTRNASESLDASCEGNPDNWDLWYLITMPFTGSVQVTGVFGFNSVSVFSACGSEISCFQGSGFIYGLQGGQNYLLRYATIPLQARPDQIFIEAFEPPAHDECDFAIDIGDISSEVSLVLDTRTATESVDVTCEDPSLQNQDLWYKFTMPFDGKVNVTGVFGVNKITLFDGCSGAELDCQSGIAFFYGLQGGVEYIVRYGAFSGHAGQDEIFIEAFPPPANDECSAPIQLGDIDTEMSIVLDAREATESLKASCEDPLQDQLDLWYEFIMPYDGNVQISGVFGNNRVGLYDGCNQVELTCDIGNALFVNLTAGATYLLRYAAIEAHANTDEIFIHSFAAAVNDDCRSAIDLGDIAISQQVLANTAAATEELDASCEVTTDENLDLWYSFEMPMDGQIDISGASGNFIFTLYDGCGGSELACFNGNRSAGNLIMGNSYLLRYASTSASAAADQFNIVASASLPVTLVSFEAFLHDFGHVDLHWQTASELNNAGFEVQRSRDGDIWVNIGWVPGQGNATTVHRYQFVDTNPWDGMNFYRLQQLDFDGSVGHSDIKVVEMRNDNQSILIYPIPASQYLNIVSPSAISSVEIYDLTGIKVVTALPPYNRIDVRPFAVGIYLLKMKSGDGATVRRIVVK